MTLRNGKVKDKKFKRTLEVSTKRLCRRWEGENLSKWFFIFIKLGKCQNECYPDNINLTNFCRRTSLHVLMFPISLVKKNLWSYWKWQMFAGNLSIFHEIKNFNKKYFFKNI